MNLRHAAAVARGSPLAWSRWSQPAITPAARAAVWQPTPGHVQMPIWPGTPPDLAPDPKPEGCCSTDVSRPTMTVYAPKGHNTGVAVVVFPGGGYQVLAMDLEGTEICDWLTSRGITCVLLEVPRARLRSDQEERPALLSEGADGACRTRSGRWGWCACTPRSGMSIRTRSA